MRAIRVESMPCLARHPWTAAAPPVSCFLLPPARAVHERIHDQPCRDDPEYQQHHTEHSETPQSTTGSLAKFASMPKRAGCGLPVLASRAIPPSRSEARSHVVNVRSAARVRMQTGGQPRFRLWSRGRVSTRGTYDDFPTDRGHLGDSGGADLLHRLARMVQSIGRREINAEAVR